MRRRSSLRLARNRRHAAEAEEERPIKALAFHVARDRGLDALHPHGMERINAAMAAKFKRLAPRRWTRYGAVRFLHGQNPGRRAMETCRRREFAPVSGT